MFSKISWGDFISAIIILSVIYYIAVAFIYYRKDILKWSASGYQLNRAHKNEMRAHSFQPEFHKPKSSSNGSRPMSYNEMTVASIEESLNQENNGAKNTEATFNPSDVHDLIEELKTIFSLSQKKKMIKQELMLTVQNKLNQYKQLRGTDIENEITQHIRNEAKEKCAIELDKGCQRR